ncbi:hypothetical protein Esti_006623 [Eimeria stiedai]
MEIQTLHRMLTQSLQVAEEEAKQFAARNKSLVEKNAQLTVDNAILLEQNEMLIREKILRQKQTEKSSQKGPSSPRKSSSHPSPQVAPEFSARYPGFPLTPRTVAKVEAKIRQFPKAQNYERELNMRAQISRLQALCSKQKRELIVLRGMGGRRTELESFLKQCLLDVKARVARKRNSIPKEDSNTALVDPKRRADELSTAGRDEVLRRFLRNQQYDVRKSDLQQTVLQYGPV